MIRSFGMLCVFPLMLSNLSCSSRDLPTSVSHRLGQDASLSPDCADSAWYRIGVGLHDITGPSAELVMLGYSDPAQISKGIWTRLWARAFVIEGPCNQRVLFVTADILALFQSVHLEVLRRLADHFGPDRYTLQNVVLSANHNHSSLAGYSHYPLYNLAAWGYDPDNFEAIVSGIVQAIVKADANLAPGLIRINRGPLVMNHNRSPQAYEQNPTYAKQLFETEFGDNTNTRMTVLRFEQVDQTTADASHAQGKPIGALVWSAGHATSVSAANRYVNSDNRGYASYLFEKDFGADYSQPHPFVAAFAQTDSGDVSPNQIEVDPNHPDRLIAIRPCDDPARHCSDLDNASVHGRTLSQRAQGLFASAQQVLRGPIQTRLRFVDMQHLSISPAFTDGSAQQTCVAAIGMSIAAGAEDGRAIDLIQEGLRYGDNWPAITLVPEDQACHQEKAILLPVGRMEPHPWVPTVLPVQVVLLGNLGVIPTPFEVSGMAGWRLRQTVRDRLRPLGVDRVIQAGYSNGYASYLTTHEEYRLQHYEGAFTLFGPWSLAAYQEQLALLTQALVEDQTTEIGLMPDDLSQDQIIPVPPVVADSPCASLITIWCAGHDFGDILQYPKPRYQVGQTVVVRFQAAHPRNDLRTQQGYLRVERQGVDRWHTVAYDWDTDTLFTWNRTGGPLSPTSEVEISWHIPQTSPPGMYRIRYQGRAKIFLSQDFESIEGISPPFLVE